MKKLSTSVLGSTFLLGLTTTVFAQGRELVVDKGRAGAIQEIQDALAVAKLGDRILVRRGNYRSFTVKRGHRILADSGVRATSIRVEGVPSGESAAIRGVTTTFGMTVTNCRGSVCFDSCLGEGRDLLGQPLRTKITASADVRFARCEFRHGILATSSAVSLDTCQVTPAFLGRTSTSGLRLSASRVSIHASTLRGVNIFFAATPAILMSRSSVHVHGPSALIAGSSATFAVSGEGDVVWSPEVSFSPANRAFHSRVRPRKLRIPSLTTSAANIGVAQTLRLAYEKNKVGVVFLGAPSAPVDLSVFSGGLWLRPVTPVFATVFPMDTAEFRFALRNRREALGFVLAWQALAGDFKDGFVLSNPSTRVVGTR